MNLKVIVLKSYSKLHSSRTEAWQSDAVMSYTQDTLLQGNLKTSAEYAVLKNPSHLDRAKEVIF